VEEEENMHRRRLIGARRIGVGHGHARDTPPFVLYF
jgi:hypothetical protein